MNNDLLGSIVTVMLALVGVAILSVLVSRNSQTGQVIKDAFGGFSGALGVAMGNGGGFTGGAPISSGFGF